MIAIRTLALLAVAAAAASSQESGPAGTLQRGAELEAKGRLPQAASLYRDALRRFPASGEIAFRLGTVCLRQQMWPAAVEAFRRASDLRPRHVETLYYLAQACYFNSQGKEALATILKAASLAPRQPEVIQKAGQYLCDARQYAEGLEYLLKALRLDPGLEGIDFDLGMVYYRLTRIDEAKPYLEAALKKDPGDLRAAFHLAEVLTRDFEWPRAKELYQAVLAREPRNANALYGLGRSFLALEQYEPAIAKLREAAAIEPRLIEAHFQIGRALHELGREEESRRELEFFRTVRDRMKVPAPLIDDGGDTREQEARAILEGLLKENKEAEALHFVGELSLGRSGGLNAAYVVGAMYYKLGRPTEAIRVLRQGAEATPRDVNVVSYLGWAYIAAGRHPEAEATLQRALEMDSLNQLALIGMGKLHYAGRNWTQAIRYFEESKTTQVPVLLELCDAHLRAGERAAALRTAELVRVFGAGDPASLKLLETMLSR